MDCIFLAAGVGSRMKQVVPKQFYKLKGKPILVYALEVLEKIEWIDNIYTTFNEEFKSLYEKAFEDYNITKITLVEGGKTRQESVYNALKHVTTDRVMIHEAARPLIFESFLEQFTKYPEELAIVPTIPIPFTVSVGREYMTDILDRSQLHNIQLPQVFKTDVLRSSHEKAFKEGFLATEDSILTFKYGHKVKFIEGIENNIKITTPLDIIIAEQLMS
ncbi:MAG: 2-C-methyl-D-erythritol 4-phosphate cytidylyltransferase [Bacteroidales bacterium]|nr:2-C-methyl-D-erythritol 4-phosphate cytidylyltransferase [Bacteroidales bacterium]